MRAAADVPGGTAQGLTPRMQWHPDAHRKWAREELFFWFFEFGTSYELPEVIVQVNGALHEGAVAAYAGYELLGNYDVLLRVWLPEGGRDDFQKILHKRLNPKGLYRDDAFKVDRILRQWFWANEPDQVGGVRHPVEATLNVRPSPDEIRAVNELIDRADEGDPLFRRYADKDLVTVSRRERGIKMVTAIKGDTDIPNEQRRKLERSLCDIVDTLSVGERSLYYGSARDVPMRYLLLSRVEFNKYHDFRKALAVVGDTIRARGDLRTFTFPVSSAGFLCFQDHLREFEGEPDRPARPSLESLLSHPETQTVEVKATAFAPLEPWLFEGKELSEPPAYPDDTVLREIVAFLNTNAGYLVIGAIEMDKKGERLWRALEDKLGETLPQTEFYKCCGLLDPTYAKGNWDEFERKFHRLVRERILPDPGRRRLIDIRPHERDGKQLCVIMVNNARSDNYWLKTGGEYRFYIRRGSSAEELQGPEITDYLG
jgi:hypothetical protein